MKWILQGYTLLCLRLILWWSVLSFVSLKYRTRTKVLDNGIVLTRISVDEYVVYTLLSVVVTRSSFPQYGWLLQIWIAACIAFVAVIYANFLDLVDSVAKFKYIRAWQRLSSVLYASKPLTDKENPHAGSG